MKIRTEDILKLIQNGWSSLSSGVRTAVDGIRRMGRRVASIIPSIDSPDDIEYSDGWYQLKGQAETIVVPVMGAAMVYHVYNYAAGFTITPFEPFNLPPESVLTILTMLAVLSFQLGIQAIVDETGADPKPPDQGHIAGGGVLVLTALVVAGWTLWAAGISGILVGAAFVYGVVTSNSILPMKIVNGLAGIGLVFMSALLLVSSV